MSQTQPEADARFDRDVRWLFVLVGVSTAALLPFFSPLLLSRGLSPIRIGLVLSAMALASVVAAPLWSHEADTRLGTTRALVASTLATAGCAVLMIPTDERMDDSPAAAVLMAAAAAPGTALSNALALAVLGPDRANDYVGSGRFASLGWAVAVIASAPSARWSGSGPSFLCPRAPSDPCRLRPPLPPDGGPARRGSSTPAGSARRRSPPRNPPAGAVPRRAAAALRGDLGDRRLRPLADARGTRGPVPDRARRRARGGDRDPFFTWSARLGSRFGMRNLFLAGAAVSIVTLIGYSLSHFPDQIRRLPDARRSGVRAEVPGAVVVTAGSSRLTSGTRARP